MKSKLLILLMVIVAVPFFGDAQAQIPSDVTSSDQLTEIVDGFETLSAEAISMADAKVSADLRSVVKETMHEVQHFVPAPPGNAFVGDKDHQIIVIRATAPANEFVSIRYRQYMPRSNLHYLAYYA